MSMRLHIVSLQGEGDTLMFLALLSRLITTPWRNLQADRRRRQAMDDIRAMPPYLQQDLGWPNVAADPDCCTN